MARVRPAQPGDLKPITEIYNQAVLTSTASFDTSPRTGAQQQAWFDEHGARHPILVAQEQDGRVVGWASLSRWAEHGGYETTAEVSVYVEHAHRGQGIGRSLVAAVLAEGERSGIHAVIARIAQGNEVSINLFGAMGFQQIGLMREVGWTFGQLLDVVLMEKLFPANLPLGTPGGIQAPHPQASDHG
jgi:phosphinothricin acetyltransferase